MRKTVAALVFALVPMMAVAQTAPDFIITNAKVYTADPANPWTEAVAISGDRITATGKADAILATADHKTRIIDARQHLVVPGFNDAETFETPAPSEVFRLSLDPNPTWNDVRAAIENAVEETAESPWIVGVIGAKAMADPQMTAAALDRSSKNRKVLLYTADGLGALVSGVAMQTLHLEATDTIGGAFESDGSGHMTGKVRGYAALSLRRRFADEVTDSEAADQIASFTDLALSRGVTSVQNASYLSAKKYERLIRHTQPQLRIRIIRLPLTTASAIDIAEGADLPARNPERPLSLVSGWTCFLQGLTPLQLQMFVKAAWESSEQTIVHADDAETLATFFSAMRAAGPPEQWRAKRLAIAGAHELTGELIPIAKEFGVVAIVRPSDPVAKTLIAGGVPLAFGSGGVPDPFRALADATAITRWQAIDAMTRGAAYAEMAENDKGTVAAGKFADLAVLSTNESLMTFVAGKIAFDAHVLPQRRKD